MTEHKNEKWLDNELQRAINTTEPQFDAETWKRKYAGEYRTLLSRRRQPGRSPTGAGHTLRLVLHGPVGKLAVAAVIMVVIGFFLGRGGNKPTGPVPPPRPVARRPAKMLTMMSLRITYQRGGEEALNQQLDEALDKLGPRPGTMSALQLYDELEG